MRFSESRFEAGSEVFGVAADEIFMDMKLMSGFSNENRDHTRATVSVRFFSLDIQGRGCDNHLAGASMSRLLIYSSLWPS